MNPALERIFSDAIRLDRPFVGKPFKSGAWECRTEPRDEWNGYFYEVTSIGAWRHQCHEWGRMRGPVRERMQ